MVGVLESSPFGRFAVIVVQINSRSNILGRAVVTGIKQARDHADGRTHPCIILVPGTKLLCKIRLALHLLIGHM